MKIRSVYRNCIWCDRLLNELPTPDLRQRTREHIVAQNIFGRIWTPDCCSRCNSGLGAQVDCKLLEDERIFTAARDAGFKAEEILSAFEGTGVDGLDRPIRYTVRNGEWRAKPQFHEKGLRIGSINGEVDAVDLMNAKKSIVARVVRSNRGIDEQEARIYIDALFERFFASECRIEVRCERTGERLRPVAGADKIQVTRNWFNYQTEWAITKVAYEVSVLLLPEEILLRTMDALQQLRAHVQHREQRNIFAHQRMDAPATKQHEVFLAIEGNAFDVQVVLFGREKWRLHFDVWQRGKPADLQRYRLTLTDDFSQPEANGIELILNGTDVTQHFLD